jgi:hypothetical protein
MSSHPKTAPSDRKFLYIPPLLMLTRVQGLKEVLYRVAARKAGCSLPVVYFHLDPFFGIDLYIQRIRDMNAGDFENTDRVLLAMYSNTVQTNNWGTKHYVTMDPVNMQTVLATQVEKFGNEPNELQNVQGVSRRRHHNKRWPYMEEITPVAQSTLC